MNFYLRIQTQFINLLRAKKYQTPKIIIILLRTQYKIKIC